MSTPASDLEQGQISSLPEVIVAGAIAGLGGGLVFGILMGMMSMLPMIGLLIGRPTVFVGFIVHMTISPLIGAMYGGTIAIHLPSNWTVTATAGAIYGIFWWVLGGLILMPLLLGMSQMVLVIGGPQWVSLVGHIAYGIITGLLFAPLNQRWL